MQKIPYASAVGSLMYAQLTTGLDIAFVVGVLGIYLRSPGIHHWKATKKIMRYLKRIKDYMITYRRSNQLEIIGYSNLDFVGYQDSKRSTSGYIYMLVDGVVFWCNEVSNHGIVLRNLVTGLQIVEGIERPLKLYCDNKSFVPYSNNNMIFTKSKHINIKFLVIKERIQSKQISIGHLRTNFMVSYPLRKYISPEVFHDYTAHMSVLRLDESLVYRELVICEFFHSIFDIMYVYYDFGYFPINKV